MSNHDIDALRALPDMLRGKEALYVEPSMVGRVRFVEVKVVGQLLVLNFRSVHRHGLSNFNDERRVSGHGSEMYASHRYLSARYVGWRFFLDTDFMRRIEQIVSPLPPGAHYYEDFTPGPLIAGARFRTHRRGPINAAVMDCIYEQQFKEGEFPNLLLTKEAAPEISDLRDSKTKSE